MEPINFSLREYYLWRDNSSTTLPWKRIYLNTEFLKYEQKRITELVKWREKFIRAKEGDKMEEAYFYTIPLELSSFWKGSIAENGNFRIIGLSGLQNSPAILTIALFPLEVNFPEDYKLIQIVESKKICVWNKKENLIYSMIIVEKWFNLKSDKIYLDVPYEKNYIQKVIKESLVADKNLSLSFQSPLVGAPYISGSVGGVSLSSLSARGPFSRELIKTLIQMSPPEYRGIEPPLKAYQGGKISDIEGVRFHFAERPYFDNKRVTGIYDGSFNNLDLEVNNRTKFLGEYSIFSTITTDYSNISSVWKNLLKRFMATEITIPEHLEELPEIDIDLTKTKKTINEDLWIQIVSARQLNPSFNREQNILLLNIQNKLKEDFDATLSDFNKNDIQREAIIKSILMPKASENITRLVQSFARGESRENLTEEDFSKARNLILDNLTNLVTHRDFKYIEEIITERRYKERFAIVETCLIGKKGSNINEIYEYVKSSGFFEDFIDLQSFLDWGRQKGFFWKDREGRYYWI